jgi:MoxR-like ATPase
MKEFKDVRRLFRRAGYSIKQDKANKGGYMIFQGTAEYAYLLTDMNTDKIDKEIKQSTVEDFIHAFKQKSTPTNASFGKGSTGPRGSKKTKNFNPNAIVSSSLKSRSQEREIEIEEEVELPKNIAPAKPIAGLSDLSPELEFKYLNAEINYGTKIPSQTNGYYFPKFTQAILHRASIGRNVWLSGPSGTGKTQFVISLAQTLKQKLVRVNFSVGTTEQHLIGRWIVKDGQTEFIYGVLPLAMKYGWWILFDEMDYAMPEHLAVLQSVLEGEPLMITQNRNEEIVPHKNFRIFATGNTKGRGDESQSYVGTGHLNLAFLDRWAIFEMEYTSKEKDIVKKIVNDDILSDQIMQYFELLRKHTTEGQLINAVFSTRRLVHLAEAMACGETINEALNYEVWTRYDSHEVEILKELAYDVWDREHYFKSGWTIGKAHLVKETPVQS